MIEDTIGNIVISALIFTCLGGWVWGPALLFGWVKIKPDRRNEWG